MKSIVVKIYVKSDCIDKFKEVTFYNSENARKEPGNLRFDVIQDTDAPNLFFLYEILANLKTSNKQPKIKPTIIDIKKCRGWYIVECSNYLNILPQRLPFCFETSS